MQKVTYPITQLVQSTVIHQTKERQTDTILF